MDPDTGRNWKKLFTKKRSELKDLKYRHIRTLEDYVHLEKEYKMNGASLIGKPVIPEYLGFEEVEQMEGIPVYKRGDFYLYRLRSHWVVITPSNTIEATIEDMMMAVKLLKALGCDVSVRRCIRGELAVNDTL